MTATEAERTVAAVFRIESPRLIATLARLTGDVGLAEEIAQDALVTALERWPRDGVPANPAAWLTTTARHRALDLLRRRQLGTRKHDEFGHELEVAGRSVEPDFADALGDALDDPIGDDLLRLMFVACHPVLARDARVALALRLLGGLTTEEIARAYLVPVATIAQRIVRAKRSLAQAGVGFEAPSREQLPERLASVLEVLYLIFNEGYAATSGDDWMRPTLCAEALRLARVLAGLAPHAAEVHGLCALMEFQHARRAARIDAHGAPILLHDQDRALWDPLLIRRGEAALRRAAECIGDGPPGPYALQAAIAGCHARAPRAADTHWTHIALLYAELLRLSPSPVVALNHAVAVSMARGPDAALPLVESLLHDPRLSHYHLLYAVHGDLLERLGRHDQAAAAFLHAAERAGNAQEQRLMQARAAACGASAAP